MTYASIEEAWGGLSGSSTLNTPVRNNISNSIHPVHQARRKSQQNNNNTENFTNNNDGIKQFEQPQGGVYDCRYGNDMSCNQAYNNNLQFNNMKKLVAQGNQPFTPWSPQPQNYMFSPQYPWYPWAKQGFLNYGGDISSMMYNYPWMFYPGIAQQIQNYQMKHLGDYKVPIQMPYLPPDYGKLWKAGKRKEHFSNDSDSNLIRNCLVIFVFFLIALSTLLVTIVIAMKN